MSDERFGVENVTQRLEWIKEHVRKGDNETAHIEEDNLYTDLLKAIAGGRCDDPGSCAKAALEAEAIDYDRWYA